MFDAEGMLEDWCMQNDIDPKTVPKDAWDDACREVENSLDVVIEHNMTRIMEDGIFFLKQGLEQLNNAQTKDGE